MFYKTILALIVLCSSAYADIRVKDTYKPYEPIVIECELDDKENTEVIYEWLIPEKVETIASDNNQKLYTWCAPGTYEIDCTAVVQYKTELEVVIRDPEDPNNRLKYKYKTVSVVQRIEVKKFTKTFKVESSPQPDPQPDPDPTPDPVPVPDPVDDPITAEGFHVLIVEETSDRIRLPRTQVLALSSTKIQSLVRNKYNGKFRQTDVNSLLSYEDERWAKAIKKIKDEDKELPWLIISNDKDWYDGKLPPTLEESLKLVNKYKPR